MKKPILRHIANLWSLVHYPSRDADWPLDRKLEAVKEAGFDGITTALTPEHRRLCEQMGLLRVGYFATSDPAAIPDLLKRQKEGGCVHLNVQLADEDTPVEVSTALAVKVIETGNEMGLEPAIEVHRDTCTETPEKTYAIADAYRKVTGRLLPMTWDFSHLAVVKHLSAPFEERLLLRPDLIQRAQQLHLRPFNGHHCQVPVTDGKGGLTPEVTDWLGFAEKLLALWLQGDQEGRELFVVPEMGPVAGGYNLSPLPNSWEDAKVLRIEIDRVWKKALAASRFA